MIPSSIIPSSIMKKDTKNLIVVIILFILYGITQYVVIKYLTQIKWKQ
jgi:hypothetical protein